MVCAYQQEINADEGTYKCVFPNSGNTLYSVSKIEDTVLFWQATGCLMNFNPNTILKIIDSLYTYR